jgi:hypothetical protein
VHFEREPRYADGRARRHLLAALAASGDEADDAPNVAAEIVVAAGDVERARLAARLRCALGVGVHHGGLVLVALRNRHADADLFEHDLLAGEKINRLLERDRDQVGRNVHRVHRVHRAL